MLYNHTKLKAAIEDIYRNRNCSYKDIAVALGVTPSTISQVRKGSKNFSYETFMLFCKTFNYDPEYFQTDDENEVIPFKVGNSIDHWLNARRIPISKLSLRTGINMFRLHRIITNEENPTLNELHLIAKILEVDSRVFEVKFIDEFAKIKKSLENVFMLSKDKVSLIIDFIEQNMK